MLLGEEIGNRTQREVAEIEKESINRLKKNEKANRERMNGKEVLEYVLERANKNSWSKNNEAETFTN